MADVDVDADGSGSADDSVNTEAGSGSEYLRQTKTQLRGHHAEDAKWYAESKSSVPQAGWWNRKHPRGG